MLFYSISITELGTLPIIDIPENLSTLRTERDPFTNSYTSSFQSSCFLNELDSLTEQIRENDPEQFKLFSNLLRLLLLLE